MRKTLLSLLTVLVMLASGYPQGAPNSRASITSDYNQVRIVAHIKVLNTDQVDKIGGYLVYKITGQVLALYKGKVEPGESLAYYMQVEKGYDMNRYRGEKIVFIYLHNTDERSAYRALENSDRQPTQRVISVLRNLKRSAKQANPTKRN